MVDVNRAIERLYDAGLLTERQAEAFVLREIELTPRPEAAESMGVKPSTLDSTLQQAKQKVESAEETLEVIDDLRHPDLPIDCTVCGSTLGGTWVENDSGDAMCFDCAGVDPESVQL